MARFRGFEGEVSTMQGLNMYNAQGNYEQGRGADGLNAWGYSPSRYGTGVPISKRPPAISGKPMPAPALDPAPYLPAICPRPGQVPWWERGTRGPILKPEAPITPAVMPPTWGRRRFPVLKRRRRRPGKAETTRQRRQFVSWIKQWAPNVYAAAKKKADIAEGAEAALGQLSGWWETFTEGVTEVGSAVLQYKTQKAILDAQLERMRAGLPPLQTGEYAPTVGVKLDPGTTKEITGAIGAGLGRMLPFIAIGGVALLLMMRGGRRRRR